MYLSLAAEARTLYCQASIQAWVPVIEEQIRQHARSGRTCMIIEVPQDVGASWRATMQEWLELENFTVTQGDTHLVVYWA